MLFVGDFFQHTFDTSRDGNVNKSLFNNKLSYEERFQKRGFFCDSTTLVKSWRCSYEVCDFITNNLGITIFSNHDKNDNNCIALITDEWKILLNCIIRIVINMEIFTKIGEIVKVKMTIRMFV